MKRVRFFTSLKLFQSLKLRCSPFYSIGTRTFAEEKKKSEYKVRLLAFSGHADPVFSVNSSHPKFNDVEGYLEQAKGKLDSTQTVASDPGLGYRGFLVNENGQYHHIVHRETAVFQKLLLEIGAESIISPPLYDVVLKCIETDLDRLRTFSARECTDCCVSGDVKNPGPPPNFCKWNKIEFVMEKNNCYNYATDTMTCTFASPGRGTAGLVKLSSAPMKLDRVFLKAAISDGLEPIDPHPSMDQPIPVPPGNKWLVALFVSTNDFHWYRLDKNGFWSHKPGQTPATDKDGNGKLITDPRKAANGNIPYQFVSFMYSQPTHPIR